MQKRCIAAELLGNCHVPTLRRHFGAFIVEIVEIQDNGNIALNLDFFYICVGAKSNGAF